MLKSVLGFMAAGALLASPVMAADQEGFFGSNSLRLGFGFGFSNIQNDNIDPVNGSFDERGTAVEGFVGYEFNRWLAVEAGYINGGNPAKEFVDGADRLEVKGFYGTVVGSLPVTDVLSFYGRAGLFTWDAEATLSQDGVIFARGKDDGSDPIFGVGAAAEFEGAQIRLEYRLAELDDTDFNVVSLSVVWRIPLSRR